MNHKHIHTHAVYVFRNIALLMLCALYVYSISPKTMVAKLGAIMLVSGFMYSLAEPFSTMRQRIIGMCGISGLLFLQLVSMLTVFHLVIWVGIVACLAILTKQS